MNLSGLFFILWGMILVGVLGLLALAGAVLLARRVLPPAIERDAPDFV